MANVNVSGALKRELSVLLRADKLREYNVSAGEVVSALLQEVLKDTSFVARNIDDNTPERKILYEDPELGFCILAHYYKGAKESAPHDHGPSWAIYGQAWGETQMSDFELLEPATTARETVASIARPGCESRKIRAG